jgi:hypothetical protein
MKKNITIIFLTLFSAAIAFAKAPKSNPTTKLDSTAKTITNNVPTSNSKSGKDSIVISIQQFDELTKLLKKEDSIMKDILPSLIALLVVIISTCGAIYIGKKQIGIQSKSGEEQLRSQEAQSQEQLRVAREQIQETSKTATKQINSNNRQDWIIDTRNTVSELMTQANLLNIEFQESTVNSDKRKAIHEKFVYNKNKLYLLLKPDKKKHKILMDSLGELLTILDTHLLNSNANNNPSLNMGFIPYNNGKFMAQAEKVIDNARDLLYEEWEKIQA